MDLGDEQQLQLSKGFTWTATPSGIAIIGDQVLHIEGPISPFSQWMRVLARGATRRELEVECTWTGDVAAVLEMLVELKIAVVRYHNEWVNTPYEKHVDFYSSLGIDGNAAQRRLLNAHVLILGVGGVGSVVLQHLAAAGIGEFTLVDKDTVALDNLNRQFIFRPDQIGEAKVQVATNYVHSINPEAIVHGHKTYVRDVESLRAIGGEGIIDFVVLAADRPPGMIERIVCGYCREVRATFLGGGCRLRSGDWGPLVTASKCRLHLLYLAERNRDLPELLANMKPLADPPSISFGPLNSLIAAAMSQDVLLHLVGVQAESDGAHLRYDPAPARLTKTRVAYPTDEESL